MQEQSKLCVAEAVHVPGLKTPLLICREVGERFLSPGGDSSTAEVVLTRGLPRRVSWGERRHFAARRIPLPPGIREVLQSAKDFKLDVAAEFPLRTLV